MLEPSYTDLVVAIYQAAVRPELWASALELVTDHLGVDSGMVLHLSASGDGNFIVHHRLRDDLNQLFLQHHTEKRDDASRLAACVKQALASARGERPTLDDTLQVSRPSGRRALLVRVTPLPPPAFLPWSTIDGGARAMVQIVDPQAPIDVQAERLRRLVGLTAAETRVAALLGSGLGLTEAAGVLGVSLNTVKTHARQVFAKAEVRSAAALARLVASIPAGPPRPAGTA